jgi:hypothetical protein
MKRMKNYGGALFLGAVLALAGCSGSNGAQGPKGADGTNGTNGTNGVNGVAGKLKLTIDSVVTANGTSTLTFTISPAAVVCPGAVCNDGLTNAVIGQKTFYAQEYNTATNTFDTAKNFSYGGIHFKGFTADGNGAQYTATKSGVTWSPEASQSAYVYAYVTTLSVTPAPTTGHYYLPGAVASAAKVFGTIAYASNANVAGCEKCHGKPYSKHGYRQATVAGLPDFVACKACHTDQRVGSDGAWYMFADDPAGLAALPAETLTTTLVAKYAYTANIMNDVHNSHAFEFNYPQFMANCVTCHAGKIGNIITDANFKPSVCKSCHPVTGPATGTQEGRAPAMKTLWAASAYSHSTIDLYANNADNACNGCHSATGTAPTFATLHKGYNEQVYKDANGTRYDASIVTSITSQSYDAPSYIDTVTFSVSGIPTTANAVTFRAYAGIYGWDTKDLIAAPSLTVTAPGADKSQFRTTANLSAYAAAIAAGQVKRIEIIIMPVVGQDATAAVSATNLAVAAVGATQTVDVTQTNTDLTLGRPDANGNPVWYKGIVDPKKCQACHDSLGTFWWHSPRNGSAGVVGCRVCHIVTSGAGFFEMQSRSIDSFLHAAHQMEIGSVKGAFDPSNPVSTIQYEKHVEGNFPNFAGPLNCEACHYPGTYNPPDQSKSLPSLISQLTPGLDRPLGTFAAEIVGPGARACGGCHRAQAINELDGNKLREFVAHVNMFGSNVDPTLSVTTTAEYIQGLVGAGPATATVPGAQIEQCQICHATAGSDHQALFNSWRTGTVQ